MLLLALFHCMLRHGTVRYGSLYTLYTRCNLSTDTRTVAVYVFSTTTTVCMSELNVLLVYPACSKLNYYASEDADSRESTRSLFASAHTSLSASALFREWLKGAALCAFSGRFSNFTCKNSRNHNTAIVFR